MFHISKFKTYMEVAEILKVTLLIFHESILLSSSTLIKMLVKCILLAVYVCVYLYFVKQLGHKSKLQTLITVCDAMVQKCRRITNDFRNILLVLKNVKGRAIFLWQKPCSRCPCLLPLINHIQRVSCQ